MLGGQLRIEFAVARIPRDGQRHAERRAGNRTDDAGIGGAARNRGRAANDAVIALEDRSPRAHVAVREQRVERDAGIGEVRQRRGLPDNVRQRDRVRTVVAHAAGQEVQVDVHHDLAAMARDVARTFRRLYRRSPPQPTREMRGSENSSL